MAVRTYLCGTSQAVLPDVPVARTVRRAPPVPRDREPVRLRTALHVPGARAVTRGYRVVAVLWGGSHALVCLGATREEVVARALAQGLCPGTVELRLQEWVGEPTSGRWRRLRWRPGELPAVPVRRERRQSLRAVLRHARAG